MLEDELLLIPDRIGEQFWKNSRAHASATTGKDLRRNETFTDPDPPPSLKASGVPVDEV